MKRNLLLVLLAFTSIATFAQNQINEFDTSDDEADDALSVTSNGEIGIGMNSLWAE